MPPGGPAQASRPGRNGPHGDFGAGPPPALGHDSGKTSLGAQEAVCPFVPSANGVAAEWPGARWALIWVVKTEEE